MHFECTRTLTGPCGTLSSPTAYQSIKNDFSQRFISLPFLRDVLIFGFMSKSSTEFIKPFSPLIFPERQISFQFLRQLVTPEVDFRKPYIRKFAGFMYDVYMMLDVG